MRQSISYEPQFRLWIGGPSGFSQVNYSLIYNGIYFAELEDRRIKGGSGAVHATIKNFDATATPIDPIHSGFAFQAKSVLDKKGRVFGRILEGYVNGDVQMKILQKGSQNLSITIEGHQESEDGTKVTVESHIELNPSWGYLLKTSRFKEVLQMEGLQRVFEESLEVSAAIDAGNGLHIPKEALFKKTVDGKVVLRTEYEGISARKLSDSESEDVFSVTLPPSTQVRDERFEIEYTTGNAPSKLIELIEKLNQEEE